MIVRQYERLGDIPGIKDFYNLMPIFASQEYADYLKNAEEHTTYWFDGIDNSRIHFVIPLTIKRNFCYKKGQFLTSTIQTGAVIDRETEKEFLNSVIKIIKQRKLCDWIEQPPNWALFKEVPDDAIFCEFATYRLDLENNSEDDLLNKLEKNNRRLIKKTRLNGVNIKQDNELINDCIKVFRLARNLGNKTLPAGEDLENILHFLPYNITIYLAYNNGNPESGMVYFLNQYCMYAIYAGLVNFTLAGLNNLLYWEAIIDGKRKGIKYFDFVGARVNPQPGSKQAGIQRFKRHFGGEFIKGYLWKMPINKRKYFLYNFIIKLINILKFKESKGDIIDQELKNKEDEKDNPND